MYDESIIWNNNKIAIQNVYSIDLSKLNSITFTLTAIEFLTVVRRHFSQGKQTHYLKITEDLFLSTEISLTEDLHYLFKVMSSLFSCPSCNLSIHNRSNNLFWIYYIMIFRDQRWKDKCKHYISHTWRQTLVMKLRKNAG